MTSPLEHSGQTKDVIVDPNDSFAAIFNASGAPNTNFTTSIIENSINIITGDGSDATKRINVSTFTFSGLTSFDGTGNVNGIKVGATFHILSNNIPGDYSGTATLRIIYL